MSCGDCGSCGGCGASLLLTEGELALLRRLGETPFLPVAAGLDMRTPIFLEDPERTETEWAAAILGLSGKGLLRVDYDVPLGNFGYEAYRRWPLHGSMALTGRGQDVLEQIEIQGIEE